MIQELKKPELSKILSPRELEVIKKRLKNLPISQTESNYLSHSVRPKLKAAQIVSSINLLSLLDYRRKKYERDEKTLKKEIISSLNNIIKKVKTVIIYGSYIRNCHTNYKDIDTLIILKKRIWKTILEKSRLEKDIEKKSSINIDVHLAALKDLKEIFPYSPLLQTELETRKIIYGEIALPKRIIINKTYLYKKLLEIEPIVELGKDLEPRYIYNAIRTCLSIELFIKKKISNRSIIKTIEKNIGKLTAKKITENKANLTQIEISLKYLNYLYKRLEEKLK